MDRKTVTIYSGSDIQENEKYIPSPKEYRDRLREILICRPPDFPSARILYLTGRMPEIITRLGQDYEEACAGITADSENVMKNFETAGIILFVIRDDIRKLSDEDWHASATWFHPDRIKDLRKYDDMQKSRKYVHNAFEDINRLCGMITEAIKDGDTHSAAGLAYYCPAACMILHEIEKKIISN